MTGNDAIFNLLTFLFDLPQHSTFYHPCEIILHSISSIHKLSIYELADLCFVSPATLSRLCRALGHRNFQEFKISMATSYRHSLESEDLDRAWRVPRLDCSAPDISRALNYLDYVTINLEQIREFIKNPDTMEFIQRLRNCDKFIFCASRKVDIIPLMKKLVMSNKQISIFNPWTTLMEQEQASSIGLGTFGALADATEKTAIITSIFHKKDLERLLPILNEAQVKQLPTFVLYPDFLAFDDKAFSGKIFSLRSSNSISDGISYQAVFDALTVLF